MAPKKASENKIEVGNIRHVRGEVNIAAGDIYKGYTAEQVSVLLTQITSKYQRKAFDGRCPYKGLDVFEEEDADLFFGRGRLVGDLINRVKETRTVFVTGPSGSGKSSLVRAGLIHSLKQGAIKNLHSDRWLYETMRPGREALEALALAFSRLKSPELAKYFRAHASEINILNECAESVLSGRKDQRFVLFVDQFEEVFTQISKEDERLTFINMLAHAGTVENGRVIVLFAMRSDFVSNCATYTTLNELLSKEFRQIGAMQPEELVSAIALPAKQVGLPIEDELIARIINDMKAEPGALPLMQFALKDLFDSQQEKGGVIALTLKDYLHHGGIHKSLERHADKSFAKLSESEQKLARSIFSGLIEIGRGTVDTRRTALFDELVPANTKAEDVLAVVGKLADARLIITDEQAGQDTITVSHEKLIDAWPWLKKLINENRDMIALQNEIAEDAKEWEEHKRDASYLYSGVRLANADYQLMSNKMTLSGTAFEFIRAAQVRQQRNRLALISTISAIIALLILAVIVFSNQSVINAQTASTAQAANTLAFEQASIAQAASTSASIQKSSADLNAHEANQQRTIALARQLAAQAQSLITTHNSTQLIGVLLAIRSVQLSPSSEAAQILRSNTLAQPIEQLIHSERISSLAFSLAGKYIASGSSDGIVHLWNTSSGTEIAHMSQGSSHYMDGIYNPTFVAFSPDGKLVVSGSADNTVRLWEVPTGKEMMRMDQGSIVESVTFSPDGRLIASAGGNTVRVWEVSTGKEMAQLHHEDIVTSVAFSPNGKLIVSGSWDYTARVWEVSTGHEIAHMKHEGIVHSVAFSPNGKWVVSGGGITARVWEIATGKEIARMTHNRVNGGISSVAFSPNGQDVASASDDGNVRIWNAMTGIQLTSTIQDDGVNLVAFSPDGNYLVSTGGTTRVWETETGKEVSQMADGGVAAFSPDGKYIVAGGCNSLSRAFACIQGIARVWSVVARQDVIQLKHEDRISSFTFSHDGKYLASGSYDKTARVWDLMSGNEITRINYNGFVTSVAFSPDGKYIVSGGCDLLDFNLTCVDNSGSARISAVATGKEIASLSQAGTIVSSVAFSPDGKWVASGWNDNIHVWDANTGQEIWHRTHEGLGMKSVTFSLDGKWLVSVAGQSIRVWKTLTGHEVSHMEYAIWANSASFSPDGRYIVTSGCDESGNGNCTIQGSARVWETTTGREIAYTTYNGDVNLSIFSPDGKYIATASNDGTARVWEAHTGKEVARMTHDGAVSSIAFSSDGKYVASGSSDKTVRIWEASTGKEIFRVIHDSYVSQVAFSPDGNLVASSSDDGIIRVWKWRAGDLIIDACSRVTRNLSRAEWQQFIGDALPYQAICPNLPIEVEATPMP